jgi:hypothetical protein
VGFEVAVPGAGDGGDVPHEGRADVDLAVVADEHGLPVAAGVARLDAHRMPAAGHDLEHDFRVAHRVAVQLSVVGDEHHPAAPRPAADVPDHQAHGAGHFPT